MSTLRRSAAARDQASPCTSHDEALFFNSLHKARPRSPEAPVMITVVDMTAAENTDTCSLKVLKCTEY